MGAVLRHGKIALPQIRRPFGGLFLVGRIAQQHQVAVGHPQAVDDLGGVQSYAAVAGDKKLRHATLTQHHDLLRQFHFQFSAAVIFFVKAPWES